MAAGDSSLVLAAASSIASGSASTVAQISAMSAAFSAVTSKPGLTAAARSAKSATAAERASASASALRRSGSAERAHGNLVLTVDAQDGAARHEHGEPRTRGDEARDDFSRLGQQLLEVVQDEQRHAGAVEVRPPARRAACATRSAWRRAPTRGSGRSAQGPRSAPSGTNAASAPSAALSDTAWSAIRVLPEPPGPVSVTSRT